jgi:hypothetical protein
MDAPGMGDDAVDADAARLAARNATARPLVVMGVSLVAAVGSIGVATSTSPAPFTVADEVTGSAAPTFTSTGPLCASGTFVDDVSVLAIARSAQARSGRGFVLVRSVYTCGDGSGTFVMLKHLTLTFTDTGFTDTGPVEILGGMDAYAGATGHGFTRGGMDAPSGLGGGTTTGAVQLR